MRWTGLPVIIAFLGVLAPSAHAAGDGRLILDEENDAFASKDDRHYTQGLSLAWATGDLDAEDGLNSPFGWTADMAPVFQGDGKRQAEIIFGQSLFTPANLHSNSPDPNDRPYAGWLYAGLDLMQDRNGQGLETVELLAGVVGPEALGKQTQNGFHQVIEVGDAHGWGRQLANEPGIVLSYERKWRVTQPIFGNLAADFIPEAGATLGNVFTYGALGGTVRFGENLGADYGPVHVRPSLSGTSWFDSDRLDGPFGWSVFAGTQGRAVGRNIFLDGNTFQNSASVDKKPLVADLVWGASAFWSNAVRLDFTVTERTKEYTTQPFKDRFGMITLSVGF